VALAPDGRTVAAGQQRLRCLALSPDGALLAAGTRTQGPAEVRLWDLKTGRALPALGGHENIVRGVAFSREGALFASACNDGKARWWQTAGWRLRGQAEECDRPTCLAFAPDGQAFVTGNQAGGLRLWNLPGGGAGPVLRGHAGRHLRTRRPDPGLRRPDHTIRLWQTTTGRELIQLEGHRTRVDALAFTPDGRTLASADHDGVIKLWSCAAPADTVLGSAPPH
jgi:WD40 repeat protein